MSSKIKVLIVDDSATDSGLIASALENNDQIETVARLSSADSALGIIKKSGDYKVEVNIVVLDSDLNGTDGFTILSEICRLSPATKVIMVLPLNPGTAAKTIQSLEMGAADYIVNISNEEDAEDAQLFKDELLQKVLEIGGTAGKFPIIKQAETNEHNETNHASAETPAPSPHSPEKEIKTRKLPLAFLPEIIAIASSTGGPASLNKILTSLKGSVLEMPVFITQHMPRDFTRLLAEQISLASGYPCYEAQDGMKIENGSIYLAPGDYHMTVKKNGDNKVIELNQNEPENFCRPSADPMMRSLVLAYGGNKIIGVVLTGMGKDGLQGCKSIIENGGVVIAQDYESSSVWGMPGAVAGEGICSYILPPEKIALRLRDLSGGRIL